MSDERRWGLEYGCGPLWTVVTLLLLLCGVANASDALPLSLLEHKTWGAGEGAPANAISIIEDQHGLIWLTSPSGLYTFNGISFAPFALPQDIDPATAVIFSLTNFPSGNTWGASRIRGLIRIDLQHRVTAYGPAQGLPAHPVHSIVEDQRGDAWTIGDGNLYHLVQDRWRDETRDRGLPPGEVASNLIDREGVHWIATKTALFVLRPDQQKVQPTLEHWESTTGDLLDDPKGGIWMVSHALDGSVSFRQLDLPKRPFWYHDTFHVPHGVFDARFDRSGALWLTGQGTERVTFRSEEQEAAGGISGAAIQIQHFGVAEGLSSDSTRALLEDNQGDMWVATMHGLDRFRAPTLVKASLPIIDSSTSPDLAPGIAGQVWMGGSKGALYSAIGNNYVSAVGLTIDSYQCLFQDREGGLWFNSARDLWHYVDGHPQVLPPPDGINAGRLRQVVQLGDGSLLFSFYDRGVWRRVQEHWERSPIGNSTLEYPLVLLVDSNHEVWAGYASGKVTKGDGYHEQTVLDNGDSLGAIAAIYEGPLGILASGQRGLAALIQGQLHRLHFADNRLAENASGIVQSEDGDLWLNGRYGVVRVRAADFKEAIVSGGEHLTEAHLFTEADLKGPAPFFYDLPTAAKDKTGRLWFNTASALVYVDPAKLDSTPVLPTLSMVALLADGVSLSPGAPIPPGTHTVRIQYFGSNLTAPEDVRYRYRLAGVDNAWQDVEERTEAVYTRLRPGNFIFEVSARNSDNQWTTPMPVQFRVEPTFFQKPIFLILCTTLLVGVGLLVYRLRVAWLVRRLQERADARLEERVRLARDLHDTLLQGFQGLILRFHVAARKVPEQTDVREQLDGALLRAEKMMLEGRNRIILLRADDLSGFNLHVALQSVCEELAEHSGTSFSVTNDGQVHELKALVKDELYWIAREALTNSFNHAEAKEVRLSCDYGQREFRFICQDDGRGIESSVEQAGGRPGHYGLAGMRERAQKINARLSCVSAPMQGTRIELALPARYAYPNRSILPNMIRSFFSKFGEQLQPK